MTDRATPRGSVSTSFWTPVSRSSLLRKKGAVTRVFHSKYLFLSWPGSRRCFLPIVRHERRMCAASTVSQKFANNYRRPPGTHRTPSCLVCARMMDEDPGLTPFHRRNVGTAAVLSGGICPLVAALTATRAWNKL